MLEAPAAAEDKAAGEEQGEPADSAPHTGAAPDPACVDSSQEPPERGAGRGFQAPYRRRASFQPRN